MTEKNKIYKRESKTLVENFVNSRFMTLLLKLKGHNAGIYQVSIEFLRSHADPRLRNVTNWHGKNWTQLGIHISINETPIVSGR